MNGVIVISNVPRPSVENKMGVMFRSIAWSCLEIIVLKHKFIFFGVFVLIAIGEQFKGVIEKVHVEEHILSENIERIV